MAVVKYVASRLTSVDRFVAICDPVSRRKWIPAVNFAEGREERFAMQLCDRDESFNPVCAATGQGGKI